MLRACFFNQSLLLAHGKCWEHHVVVVRGGNYTGFTLDTLKERSPARDQPKASTHHYAQKPMQEPESPALLWQPVIYPVAIPSAGPHSRSHWQRGKKISLFQESNSSNPILFILPPTKCLLGEQAGVPRLLTQVCVRAC